jgi:hypothetical protein
LANEDNNNDEVKQLSTAQEGNFWRKMKRGMYKLRKIMQYK